MTKMSADVVIVGGGIIGCATAYYLAKQGVTDVVVVERDFLASGSTGRCGAGVRQQWGLKMNILLAKESIKAFETLNEELDTGLDIEFKQQGYLMLAYTEKMVEQHKERRPAAVTAGCACPADFSCWPGIVPHLNTDGLLAATFCPTDGHISPFTTTNSYAIAARRLGVRIMTGTEVTGIEVRTVSVVAVETSASKIHTNAVLNASGGYSRRVAALWRAALACPLPRTPSNSRHRAGGAHSGSHGHLLHHGFYCQQTPTAVLSWVWRPNELKEHVVSSTWHLWRRWRQSPARASAGPTPGGAAMGGLCICPDAQPILGEAPACRFYNAVGFSGHGFMLGPVTGMLMAELISGKEPHIDISPLSLERL